MYSHDHMVAAGQFAGCLASSIIVAQVQSHEWVATCSLLLVSICAPRFLHS